MWTHLDLLGIPEYLAIILVVRESIRAHQVEVVKELLEGAIKSGNHFRLRCRVSSVPRWASALTSISDSDIGTAIAA